MFLINSRSASFVATPKPCGLRVGHLANLRPAFVAEFLKDSSLDRLCILNSPTCVGLGYGFKLHSLRGFS